MNFDTVNQTIYSSINLENDVGNYSVLNNIVLTKPLSSTLKQLNSAITIPDGRNSAISIVGPYGSGKSTTALVCYYYLLGKLPKNILEDLNLSGITPLSNPYKKNDIYIVTGKKISLEEHLQNTFDADDVEKAIIKKINDDDNFILIIDEFGKYLEYYADNPKNGDVYLLQQLAEIAQRSVGRFTLLTIRHQSISAYFSSLNSSYLNEWKKIQGRFSDIIHTTNITETLKLLTTFIQSRYPNKKTNKISDSLRSNNHIRSEDIDNYLSISFPLHPYTSLILISAFKKIAQNERSIFTFLDSDDLFSLKFIIKNRGMDFYEISDFYDYLESNMKFHILESDIKQSWSLISDTLNNLRISNVQITKSELELAESIIKTIGIVQLFGRDVGLVSSLETISTSCIKNDKSDTNRIKRLLKLLIQNGIVSYRKLMSSYILWSGSDININEIIEEQVSELPQFQYLYDFINSSFTINPIVAQRHLVKTGTPRWAKVVFCNKEHILSDNLIDGDGEIRIIVATSDYQVTKFSKYLRKTSDVMPKKVVPMVLKIDKTTERELKILVAINELLLSNEEIRRDNIARKELIKLKHDYHDNLNRIFLHQDRYNSTLHILEKNKLKKVQWNAINKELSNKFDYIYNKTPQIHNELINKEKPSPSATVGIKKLFKYLVKNSAKEKLELDGNGPEKSIYLNALKQPGIHRKIGKSFRLAKPDKDMNLLSLWNDWNDIILNSDSKKKNLTTLIEYSQHPPYGLKYGLAKVLSIVKLVENINHISLYKTDREIRGEIFVPEIKEDTIELLVRRPDIFQFRYVVTEKIHKNLFIELISIIENEDRNFATLLDAVTPLIKFVNGLSHFTKTTQKIGERFHNVIQSIDRSISPEELIYHDVPVALKLNPISNKTNTNDIKVYIRRLKDWHNIVHNFEETLLDNIHKEFIIHWNIENTTGSSDYNSTSNYLKEQISEEVYNLIVDFQIKEFAKRALTDIEDGKIWFESIASSIAGSRPQNWNDDDYSLYIERTNNFKSRILELIALARKKYIWKNYSSNESEKIKDQIVNLLDNDDNDLKHKLVALIKAQELLEQRLKEKS